MQSLAYFALALIAGRAASCTRLHWPDRSGDRTRGRPMPQDPRPDAGRDEGADLDVFLSGLL
jgi:hypothetical protein